ncbi:MAG TPA: oligosaccharide flippase family protein [Solirubrobacteraceae bacterium]|nr:oligosaccharide flippase family protein [Solirubrobacteraceae bacterium]
MTPVADGAPLEGAPGDGGPLEGAPGDGAPLEGAAGDGAPVDGAPVEGAPVDEALAGDILSTSAAGAAAARGGGLRVGAYIVGALFSVISASLLTRHLGVARFGQYITALSLVAIVGALSDLGLTAVGVRELSTRPPAERWPLARDLLGLRIALTLAGGVAIVAIAWLAYSPTLAAGVALACVGLLLAATQDNFALPLLIGLRLGTVSALELSRQLLTTVFTIVLVFAGAALVPFLGVSIPVGAIVLVATALLVRNTRALTPTFSFERWRRFVRPMLPYSAAIAASSIYLRVSIVLVSALGTAVQLGYFSLSYRIVEVLTPVPVLLASSALPIFAHTARDDDHDRLGYALARVFEVSLIVGAWVAVSIAVGAPLALAIVGGPRFAPAAPVLAVQGIGLGAMFVSLVWANGLLGLGLYRQILAISLAGLLLTAALVAALIPIDGAQGAAIGTSTGEVALAIAQCVAVVRRRPPLRPSLRVLPGVALAAALALAPLALTSLPVIVRLLISTALFAGAVLLTRAYPPELLDLLPGRPAGRA